MHHRVIHSPVLFLFFFLFSLLFLSRCHLVLSLIHQLYRTSVPGSTITLVFNIGSNMSQDGSARSDPLLVGRRNSVVLDTLRE